MACFIALLLHSFKHRLTEFTLQQLLVGTHYCIVTNSIKRKLCIHNKNPYLHLSLVTFVALDLRVNGIVPSNFTPYQGTSDVHDTDAMRFIRKDDCDVARDGDALTSVFV